MITPPQPMPLVSPTMPAPVSSGPLEAPQQGTTLLERHYIQTWADGPGDVNTWREQVLAIGGPLSSHASLDDAITAAIMVADSAEADTETLSERTLGVVRHGAEWAVWQLSEQRTNIMAQAGKPLRVHTTDAQPMSASRFSSTYGNYYNATHAREATIRTNPDLAAVVTDEIVFQPVSVEGAWAPAVTFNAFSVTRHAPGTTWFDASNPHYDNNRQ